MVPRHPGAVDTLAGMAAPADGAPGSGRGPSSPKAMAAASRRLARIGSRFGYNKAVARQPERAGDLPPLPRRAAVVEAPLAADFIGTAVGPTRSGRAKGEGARPKAPRELADLR